MKRVLYSINWRVISPKFHGAVQQSVTVSIESDVWNVRFRLRVGALIYVRFVNEQYVIKRARARACVLNRPTSAGIRKRSYAKNYY